MDISKITVQDVLNSGMSTLLVIKAEDLKQTIYDAVNEAKRALEEDIALKNSDMLLTTNQVLERLKVSRTTLWVWVKKKFIVPIEIGGRQRYKLSDINAILESGDKLFK